MYECIDKEVDAIAILPLGEDIYEPVTWKDALQEVKDAGIPLIPLERTFENYSDKFWTSFVVNDYYEEGKMAAEWLVDYLNQQGRSDESVRIVELLALPEDYLLYDLRCQGFRDGIDEHEKLEITSTQYGYLTYEEGYEAVKKLLKTDQDFQVIYALNDEMALGAVEAIEEAGLRPGEDIIIIGIDGNIAALQAIVDGTINCSVECNPLMGDLFMEICVRLANGETAEKTIHPEDQVFDRTNAEQEIEERERAKITTW